MIADGDEKRLVQNYKATNRQLRKQLENLNNQVDKALSSKINRIGLKKLPQVEKTIDKSQNVKFLQLEVDNQRKRLQHLQRDNQNLKVRRTVDHMSQAKLLQQTLSTKKAQKDELKKEVYWMNKESTQLNTSDLPNQELKLYDKIQLINQQLIRTKKIEAELEKQLSTKHDNQNKKTSFIEQSKEHYQKAAQEAQKIMKSRVQMPVTYQTGPDEEWKKLKKEFLALKQSKIWEQTSLKEQNDRLRGEVRELELRLKQKKYKLENIRSLEIRRKQRNYSTLDQSNSGRGGNVRYRDRNNSYKNTTKS